MQMVKTEKRSLEALDAENLPIHNAGEHSSPPPPKRFLEVAKKPLKTREEKTLCGS